MPNGSIVDLHRGYRHPFMFGVYYFGGVGDTPRTLAELAMSMFSAELRLKPEWWQHCEDDTVTQIWRNEARKREWNVRTPSTYMPVKLSTKQIDYVVDELVGYAALRDEKYKCQVSCFERIWESDSVIEPQVASDLQNELAKLRNNDTLGPGDITDTLIDPMLYCLVYNRTLVSSPDIDINPLPPPPSPDIYTVSPCFALLPAEVYVPTEGSTVTFTSYINNLHPEEHQPLYQLLEQCLTGFIPLFERCLTDLHRNNPLMQRIQGRCKYNVWDEPDPPDHSDDEEGWTSYERELRHWVMNRPIQLPDVPSTGYPGGLENRRRKVSLRNRSIQVIVEVSETRLNEHQPSFPGSPWHVEGMRNERIVACGYMYLKAENVSESSVEFRMAVTSPRGFTAGDSGGTLRTWGLRDGDSCHQYIGSVSIREGLSIVFPNIYQHRQTSYHLTDKSKDGHLLMVSFFLVDPEIQPIISTARVAPQQKDWIQGAVEDTLAPKLPAELIENVMAGVQGLMDKGEAENYRTDMLRAQSVFRQANDNYHFCIPFDIWNGPDIAR